MYCLVVCLSVRVLTRHAACVREQEVQKPPTPPPKVNPTRRRSLIEPIAADVAASIIHFNTVASVQANRPLQFRDGDSDSDSGSGTECGSSLGGLSDDDVRESQPSSPVPQFAVPASSFRDARRARIRDQRRKNRDERRRKKWGDGRKRLPAMAASASAPTLPDGPTEDLELALNASVSLGYLPECVGLHAGGEQSSCVPSAHDDMVHAPPCRVSFRTTPILRKAPPVVPPPLPEPEEPWMSGYGEHLHGKYHRFDVVATRADRVRASETALDETPELSAGGKALHHGTMGRPWPLKAKVSKPGSRWKGKLASQQAREEKDLAQSFAGRLGKSRHDLKTPTHASGGLVSAAAARAGERSATSQATRLPPMGCPPLPPAPAPASSRSGEQPRRASSGSDVAPGGQPPSQRKRSVQLTSRTANSRRSSQRSTGGASDSSPRRLSHNSTMSRSSRISARNRAMVSDGGNLASMVGGGSAKSRRKGSRDKTKAKRKGSKPRGSPPQDAGNDAEDGGEKVLPVVVPAVVVTAPGSGGEAVQSAD